MKQRHSASVCIDILMLDIYPKKDTVVVPVLYSCLYTQIKDTVLVPVLNILMLHMSSQKRHS